MDEEEQRRLQEKHRQETSAMLRRVLIAGSIKLVVLSVISALFVYWYMY